MNKLLPFVLLILCFNVFPKVVPVIPHYEIPQDKEPPFKDYVLFKSNKKIDLYRSKEMVNLNSKQGLEYNIDTIRNLKDVDSGGNIAGPVDIHSSESENPRFLVFKFTTNNVKFSVKDVSFEFFATGEDVSNYTKLTAAEMKVVDGIQYAYVDIFPLDPGEHQVVLQINTQMQKNNGIFQDKHTRYARANFTRPILDSAHASLEKQQVKPSGEAVVFSMANSYSDYDGIIESYLVEVLKDGQVIESANYNVSENGTAFVVSFKEIGDYQIRMTVKDSFQDENVALSEVFNVVNTTPILNYQLTQDPQYPDILQLDFTGTQSNDGADITHYVIYVWQNDQEVASFWSYYQPKFEFQVPVRGNFDIGIWARNSKGISTSFSLDPLNYLDPSIPNTLFLKYRWGGFWDSNDPRVIGQGVALNSDYSDFSKWILRGTSTTGESYEYEQNWIDLPGYWSGGDQVVNVIHTVPGPGTWNLETIYVTTDGRESRPLKRAEIVEYDPGIASFEVERVPVYEASDRVNKFVIKNATPGNYGWFEYFKCAFKNRETGLEEEHFLWQAPLEESFQLYFPSLGNTDVSCEAKTNMNLFASFNFSYEIKNVPPTISSTIELLDLNSRTYRFSAEFLDLDGWITEASVILTYPDGRTEENWFWGFIDLQLYIPGVWSVQFKTRDNDGQVVYTEAQQILVLNDLPAISSVQVELINSDTNLYQFNFNANDQDGYVASQKIEFYSPNNEYSSIGGSSAQKELSLTGIWTIVFNAIDNEGGQVKVTRQVDIIGKPPVAGLVLTKIDDANYILDASSSTDPDSMNLRYKFTFTNPQGSSYDIINTEAQLNYTFTTDGDWIVSLIVIDESNNESTNEQRVSILIDTLPPDPGEAGKQTLAGIDSDGDGVRDDVERYIASLPLEVEKKEVLRDYAKTVNIGILVADLKDESIQNTFDKLGHRYCLQAKLGEAEYDNYPKLILVKHYNTRDRIYAWVRGDTNFSGQLVTIEKDESQYSAYCN